MSDSWHFAAFSTFRTSTITHPVTQQHTQWHSITPSDTASHPVTQHHIQWHSITSSDTASHPVTQHNIQWHSITSSDTVSHPVTQQHTQWHSITSSDTASHPQIPLTWLSENAWFSIQWFYMAGSRNRCWASWTAVMDHYSSRSRAVEVGLSDLQEYLPGHTVPDSTWHCTGKLLHKIQ
jgi:hypothetical protein